MRFIVLLCSLAGSITAMETQPFIQKNVVQPHLIAIDVAPPTQDQQPMTRGDFKKLHNLLVQRFTHNDEKFLLTMKICLAGGAGITAMWLLQILATLNTR